MSTVEDNELEKEQGSSKRNRHAAPKSKKTKRRHRAQYPTPEFYFFAFLLNLATVIVAGWLLFYHPTDIPLLTTGLLGVVGLIISVYSITIRPKESNKKLRKILVALTAAYGFILLVIHAINILTNPSTFV